MQVNPTFSDLHVHAQSGTRYWTAKWHGRAVYTMAPSANISHIPEKQELALALFSASKRLNRQCGVESFTPLDFSRTTVRFNTLFKDVVLRDLREACENNGASEEEKSLFNRVITQLDAEPTNIFAKIWNLLSKIALIFGIKTKLDISFEVEEVEREAIRPDEVGPQGLPIHSNPIVNEFRQALFDFINKQLAPDTPFGRAVSEKFPNLQKDLAIKLIQHIGAMDFGVVVDKIMEGVLQHLDEEHPPQTEKEIALILADEVKKLQPIFPANIQGFNELISGALSEFVLAPIVSELCKPVRIREMLASAFSSTQPLVVNLMLKQLLTNASSAHGKQIAVIFHGKSQKHKDHKYNQLVNELVQKMKTGSPSFMSTFPDDKAADAFLEQAVKAYIDPIIQNITPAIPPKDSYQTELLEQLTSKAKEEPPPASATYGKIACKLLFNHGEVQLKGWGGTFQYWAPEWLKSLIGGQVSNLAGVVRERELAAKLLTDLIHSLMEPKKDDAKQPANEIVIHEQFSRGLLGTTYLFHDYLKMILPGVAANSLPAPDKLFEALDKSLDKTIGQESFNQKLFLSAIREVISGLKDPMTLEKVSEQAVL